MQLKGFIEAHPADKSLAGPKALMVVGAALQVELLILHRSFRQPASGATLSPSARLCQNPRRRGAHEAAGDPSLADRSRWAFVRWARWTCAPRRRVTVEGIDAPELEGKTARAAANPALARLVNDARPFVAIIACDPITTQITNSVKRTTAA